MGVNHEPRTMNPVMKQPEPYPETSEFYGVIPPSTKFMFEGEMWNVMEVIPDPKSHVRAAPVDRPFDVKYISPEEITPCSASSTRTTNPEL